jgi:hypothetical protein
MNYKHVYIAGPFSGKTRYEVEGNIWVAQSFILPLAEVGAVPVCVHTMFGALDGTLSYERWMLLTEKHLDRSDAILMVPDWVRSSGAKNEKQRALNTEKPVFYASILGIIPRELVEWLIANDGWDPFIECG